METFPIPGCNDYLMDWLDSSQTLGIRALQVSRIPKVPAIQGQSGLNNQTFPLGAKAETSMSTRKINAELDRHS